MIVLPKSIQIDYITDKETKGTFRFKPKDDSVIGNATIYIPKSFLKDQEIDPEKGFTLEIKPK